MSEFNPPILCADLEQRRLPQFCVAVLGISSCELSLTTDGSGRRRHVGVGKSCLCARFVCPSNDGYHSAEENYSSVFPESEFNGREANGVHFLYFGSVNKRAADCERSVVFHVVEHTTLVDENYRPHLSTTSEAYVTRATATQLHCPAKVVYSRGRERNSRNPNERFPDTFDGRESGVGGFILLLDPTRAAHELQSQLELIEALLQRIEQTGKPYALVLTKCDAIPAEDRKHVEETVAFQLGELTNGVPIFQVSARYGISVDLPFQHVFATSRACGHCVRPLPFAASSQARADAEKRAEECVQKLVTKHVLQFNTTWAEFVRSVSKGASSDVAAFAALYSLKGEAVLKQMFRVQLVHVLANDLQTKFQRSFLGLLSSHADRPDQVVNVGAAGVKSVFCPCRLAEYVTYKGAVTTSVGEDVRGGLQLEDVASSYYNSAVTDVLGTTSTTEDAKAADEDVFLGASNQESGSKKLLEWLLGPTSGQLQQDSEEVPIVSLSTPKKRWSMSAFSDLRQPQLSGRANRFHSEITSVTDHPAAPSLSAGKRKVFWRRSSKEDQPGSLDTTATSREDNRTNTPSDLQATSQAPTTSPVSPVRQTQIAQQRNKHFSS